MSTVLQCNWESQSLVRDLSFGGKIRSLLYRHLLKMRKLFIAPFPSHELRKRHLNSYGGIKVQQHPGDLVQAPAIFLTLSLTQLSSPQVCGWWASPPSQAEPWNPSTQCMQWAAAARERESWFDQWERSILQPDSPIGCPTAVLQLSLHHSLKS